MPFAVVFEPRAVREMTEARAWWAERRRPIDDAIAKALRLLEHCPAIAPRWQGGRGRSAVHRLSVGRTGYHFYYRLNRESALIVVAAFWHERRRPPRL